MPVLYGIIIFLLIAWILQAWDVYQLKIIQPIGNFFENTGSLIWIAFSLWLLLFLYWQGKLTNTEIINKYKGYLSPELHYPQALENFQDARPLSDKELNQALLEGTDPKCGCPTAFPREQRFSDGKTFNMGVIGSNYFPLPIHCGQGNECAKPIPAYQPKEITKWSVQTSGLLPSLNKPKKEPQPNDLEPTYRDIHGVGPRSFWCIENDKCVRHEEDPLRPWKNTCGSSTWLSQVPPPVYQSLESCQKGKNPCDNLEYHSCIETERCGWCQDRNGNGKCVSGTQEGPLDLSLNCTPNLLQPSGAWIPGYPNTYIGQTDPIANTKEKEWNFNPEVQPNDIINDTRLTPNQTGWKEMRNRMTPPKIDQFIHS